MEALIARSFHLRRPAFVCSYCFAESREIGKTVRRRFGSIPGPYRLGVVLPTSKPTPPPPPPPSQLPPLLQVSRRSQEQWKPRLQSSVGQQNHPKIPRGRQQTFSTTSACTKKQKNQHAQDGQGRSSDSKEGVVPGHKVAEDIFDFTELDAGLASNIEKFKDELSTLKAGGRFDPEIVENLRVPLKEGTGDDVKVSMVKLADLATVVPKGGRSIMVIVAEQQHLKPVSSAILASPHSLNPSPDPNPDAPLTLNVPIPPPTAESRNAVKQQAKAMFDRYTGIVRGARGDYVKKLRRIELDKKMKVARDDMVKAQKEMEKKYEAAAKDVKRIWEDKAKALDR